MSDFSAQVRSPAPQLTSASPPRDRVARIIAIMGAVVAIAALSWQIYTFSVQQLARQASLSLRPIIRSEIKSRMISLNPSGGQDYILILEWEMTNVGKEALRVEVKDVGCSIRAASTTNGTVNERVLEKVSLSAGPSVGYLDLLGGGDTTMLTAARKVAAGFYLVECSLPLEDIVASQNGVRTLVSRSYATQKFISVPQGSP